MSLTNAMELAVKACPGMNSREVTVAIKDALRENYAVGMDRNAPVTYGEVTRVSALLSQSWQRKKLDRRQVGSHIRYYPNQKTGRDQRNGGRSAPAPVRAILKRAPKPAKPAAPMREPAPPPKPSAEQQKSMSAHFKKPAKDTAVRAQTVDEFVAAGGRIQYLLPGVSGLKHNASSPDDDTN